MFQRAHILHSRDFGATIDEPSPSVQDSIGSEPVTHVLFFDGGSRGNPGPGGSGVCVTKVDPLTGTATILWSAAMSHAHSATRNNQAEYQGLITGLRAAHQNKWFPLEVVGDSALILQQLRSYRKPKNYCLLRFYAITRRLADLLDVRRWVYHPRASNKMADSLANHAMDHRHSSQAMHPTARTGHVNVDALLSNDLRPWFAASSGDQVD